MNTVRLNDYDILILWSLPKPGCDLLYLLRSYHHSQRAAIPSYDDLSACFTRAVHAGLMKFPQADKFELFPESYQQLHAWDDRYSAGEEGIWEHGDELSERNWPIVESREFLLNRKDYDAAVAGFDRHWQKVLKSVDDRRTRPSDK